jgi:hypothetical protein
MDHPCGQRSVHDYPATAISGCHMSKAQLSIATLGVPRIGRRRELKFALESYWSGKSSAVDLLEKAKSLRAGEITALP